MKRNYLIKRILQAVITVLLVIVLNYILFRVMPGNPLAMIMRNPKASPEAVKKVEALFGLDKPWYVQFGVFFKQLLKGDFGLSFTYKKPVIEIIGGKVLPTILLTAVSEIIAIIIGIIIGTISAWKRGTKADVISLSFSLITYSMPTFWLGIVLVAFFSVYLGAFPTTGMTTPGLSDGGFWMTFKDVAKHLFLPALTLSLVLIGEYALVMRNSLLDVLSEDYINTARAKGLTEKDIIKKHAIPNARLPMVTIIAINMGFMIAGAIQVETVFSWPGIGRLMYDALSNRDYPLLQGIFFIISVSVVLANLIADILYSYLDPRIKN